MKANRPSFSEFSAGDVVFVAAVSADGFISKHRGIPWELPWDRAHFRSITKDRWLLVGRVTFGEMTDWFGSRIPLVLSGEAEFTPHVGHRVTTVAEAIALAGEAGQPLMVIGGGNTYEAAFAFATHLIVTSVDHRLGAGVPFPVIDAAKWQRVDQLTHPADPDHAHSFSIETWVRRHSRET